MRLWIFIFINLFICQQGLCENIFPQFNNQNLKIEIPSNLPLIKKDPGKTINDKIVYYLKGQIFKGEKEGILQTVSEGFSGKSDKSTPWETLTEMLASYHAKNLDKMITLYGAAEQKTLRKMPISESKKLMEKHGQIKKIKINLGYQYKKGFLVSWIDPTRKIPGLSFFKKIKGKYLLSSVDVGENDKLFWNVGLYLTHAPKPLLRPKLKKGFKTISENQKKKLSLKLKNKGYWLTIFTSKVDSQVLFTVQDNDVASNKNFRDLNKKSGLVELEFNREMFSQKKDYQLYAIESNYPIWKVNKTMIDKALVLNIKAK